MIGATEILPSSSFPPLLRLAYSCAVFALLYFVFEGNRPFGTSDHVVQNPPCWRASSLLFPHWDIKTKRPEPVKLDLPLF